MEREPVNINALQKMNWRIAPFNLFLVNFVYMRMASAQPRGESASVGYEDPLGALWIFAAVAIYSAFQDSRRLGLQVISFFALLCFIWVASPRIGAALIGLLVLIVFGAVIFNKFK